MSIAALVLLAASPGAEALELARVVVANGTLATLGPLMARSDIDGLIAAHPELAAAEQADLRATAEALSAQNAARLLEAEAQAYAAALPTSELRALAAFARSKAAASQRKAMPTVIRQTMAAAKDIDFKGDVTKAFCAKTGKLCSN